MSNSPLMHRAIVKFLSIYKTDNSLRNLFLRKLDNDMSWTDAEISCKLTFPFVEGDKKNDAWIKNFSFLYVYSILSKWREQFPDDKTIDKRLNDFSNNNKDQIKENLEEFCDNNIILPSAASDILYYIDCFNWIEYGLIPKYATSTKYDKYSELLNDYIEQKSINDVYEDIVKYLGFCKATDVIAKKDICLKSILTKLLQSKIINSSVNEQLRQLLEKEPYDGKSIIGFDILKQIVTFYIRNKNIYASLENENAIWEIQMQLWKIRIGDYLYNYKEFVKELCPDPFRFLYYNEGTAKEYFSDFFSPYEDEEAKEKYIQYIRPWNFIQCEEETHLSHFLDHFVSLYAHVSRLHGGVYEECNAIVSETIFEARSIKSSEQQNWTIKSLKTKLENLFREKDEKLYQELNLLLNDYKRQSIIRIINTALENCDFPSNKDEKEQYFNVVYNESNLSSESLLKIIIFNNSIGIEYNMEFPLPTAKVDNNANKKTADYYIPSGFIKEVIHSWFKWWSGIKDSISNDNELQIRQRLQNYLKFNLRIAYNYIISYLDYDYISYMKESEGIIIPNSSDSDGHTELKDWLVGEAERGGLGW